MIKAANTPGTHPRNVSIRTISTEPQPLSITASGGSTIASNTRQKLIFLTFYFLLFTFTFLLFTCPLSLPARQVLRLTPPMAGKYALILISALFSLWPG
jgi:hypothetical protein